MGYGLEVMGYGLEVIVIVIVHVLHLHILDNIHVITYHILHILIRQLRMQWQGHLINEQVVGIRIVLDVKSQCLVRRHHRQRLVMHITNNSPLRHLHNNLSTFLITSTHQTSDIQMPT